MLAWVLALVLGSAAAGSPTRVLLRAFSHNDYRQARPLRDALDRGFFAVEADVHLREGELLVGHGGDDVRPGVTLQRLYLDPLLERTRANGGRVYPGEPGGFLLLVDFKSDADLSYMALRRLIEGYKEMLTRFTPHAIEEKAVTLVISGHRPRELLRSEPVRYAALDGRMGELQSPDKTLYPLISDSFPKYFRGRPGGGEPLEKRRLELIVAKAHQFGRKLRFYEVPNHEEYWQVLNDAGVDYLNVDKLERLRRFLSGLRARLLDRFSDSLRALPRDPFAGTGRDGKK